MISKKLQDIIDKVDRGERITRDDCIYILSLPIESYEAGVVRSKANELIRKKNDNAAIIIAQIGVDIHPCKAKCNFCSFGEGHTSVPKIQLDKASLKRSIEDFCKDGDLYGLYLMTMADTDQAFLLEMIKYAREVAPAETQIWINTGDNDKEFYEKALNAGATGAYHVCRLREGIDTAVDPQTRIQSMRNIVDAGLQLFSCCEPVGPEHNIEEIADSIMLCVDMGVTQFGAMKRIAVPDSPLYEDNQISNLQMAHIMGCVGLAYASVDSAYFFGIHEPSELGYLSGANFVTAETGANPRDTVLDTSEGRGWDMNRCRKLLFECGFTKLLRGDGSEIPLDYDYLKKTNSFL